WFGLHRDFHRALTAACGSPLLRDIGAKLFDRARRYRTLSMLRPAHVRAKAAEHRALMQAALDRDADRA
ncbi:FCD domain-containing protein, partial [Vibrio parahaemolyticus]